MGKTGKLLFKAYKRTGAGPDCSGTAAFTSALIPTTGSDTKSSGNFNTGAANAGAGTYDWLVTWTSDDPLVLGVTSTCGDQTGGNDETSDVGKAHPQLTTDAGATVRLGPTGVNLTDQASLSLGFNPTGLITFHLYRGATCSAATEVALSPVGIDPNNPLNPADGQVHGNGNYYSVPIHVTLAGQYRWIANYDPNGDRTTSRPTTVVRPAPTCSTTSRFSSSTRRSSSTRASTTRLSTRATR